MTGATIPAVPDMHRSLPCFVFALQALTPAMLQSRRPPAAGTMRWSLPRLPKNTRPQAGYLFDKAIRVRSALINQRCSRIDGEK